MRTAFPLGAALGLFSVFAVQPVSAAPQSTPVPGLTSAGQSISAAADGSMWVSESASPGRIARVAPDGTVTEYVGGITSNFTASRNPQDVTVTPDGYVWFLMSGGSEEAAGLSTSTGAVVRYQLTNGTPTSLAAGPDGKLWMTANGDNGGTDFVATYDVATKTTKEYSTGFTANSEPRSLTLGADGALWFVEGGGAGRIGRVTTDGTVTYRDVGGAPALLSNGPGGLWFSRGTDLALLGADSTTLYSSGVQPAGIAGGPDGAMWTTTSGGVVRVTSDGVVATYDAGLAANAQGTAIAAGADGRMWLALDRSPFLVRITVPPRVAGATGATASPTTATVTATVTPNGLATSAALQLRDAKGGWSTISTTDIGDAVGASPVKFDVNGLAAGATSALRVVATNAAGAETSNEVDLTTDPAAAPAPTTPVPATTPSLPKTAEQGAVPSTDPAAAPAPVQGSTVVVRPASGTVTYRVPGSTTNRTVDGAASIPTGSTIDTTRGSVSLASRVSGADQLGTFSGGEFKVKQVKATGMTQLYLTAKLDCPAPGKASAARATTKRRHVWGQDSGGRFQTHGQDSVATVRGTKWLTTDTCAGTVVKVFQGKVSVAPRKGNGKAVLVKAGGRIFTPHTS
ncbi:MAG: hypothetical protein AAGC46_21225 [Solirubrobacteraceae bacterium]|nr:hypothetical protein [Patulibacter sp.]